MEVLRGDVGHISYQEGERLAGSAHKENSSNLGRGLSIGPKPIFFRVAEIKLFVSAPAMKLAPSSACRHLFLAQLAQFS